MIPDGDALDAGLAIDGPESRAPAVGAAPLFTARSFEKTWLEGGVDWCEAALADLASTAPESPLLQACRALYHYRRSEFALSLAWWERFLGQGQLQGEYFEDVFDCCSHLGCTETARRLAATMAAPAPARWKSTIEIDMRLAMGLDDEIALAAPDAPFDAPIAVWEHHQQALSQMRREGVAASLEAYERAWASPAARQMFAAPDDPESYDLFWGADEPPPEQLWVHPRFGLGDGIQWLRYLPALATVGVNVVVTDARLQGLVLKGQGEIDAPVSRSKLEALGPVQLGERRWTDGYALMTRLFPHLGYAPAAKGFLRANSAPRACSLLEESRVRSGGRRRLALVWSANESLRFAQKSLTVDQVLPLLALGDIHWVVAQRGYQRAAFLELGLGHRATVLPEDLSLAETGAVLEGLDGVVTCDTSIAHLAGAMGLPTAMFLSAAADGRWESAAHTTPWYPSMRLHRQARLGDWSGMVANLAEALARGETGASRP